MGRLRLVSFVLIASVFRESNFLVNFSIVIIMLKLTIVSSETFLLCPEDQLELTCSSNDSEVIQWDVTHPHMRTGVGSQFITSGGREEFTIVGSGAVYQFSKISISPLTSVLHIDNVNVNISGTMVKCYNSSRVAIIPTTVISVVENGKFETH